MIEVIRRTGIFLIIAQTMYHFISGSRYARYIRLLIRIMMLAILIVPILDFIKEGTDEDFSAKLDRFERQYEEILEGERPPYGDTADERILSTAEEELEKTLSACLLERGYEIAETAIGEERIRFVLRPAGTGERISVPPVERIRISGEKDETDEREEELGGVIAQKLGIGQQWVEVEILE